MRVLRTRGLSQLLRNVHLVAANLNSELEVSTIVLTMFDSRTRLAADVAGEVRRHFPEQVCRSVIPRTVRLSEAPSFGQPITVFDPTSRALLPTGNLQRRSAMARRSGLGKGLGALLPTEVVGDRRSALREVPISSIGQRAPAESHFDEEAMSSLLRPSGNWVSCSRSWSEKSMERPRAMSSSRGAALEGGAPGRPSDHPGPCPDGHERRPQPRTGTCREHPPG